MRSLNLHAALIFLTLVSSELTKVSAIRCYDCSDSNPHCRDPFPHKKDYSVLTRDCAHGCIKQTRHEKTTQHIERGCADEDRDQCFWDEPKSGENLHVCYCTTTLCNTGTRPRSRSTYSLVWTAASILIAGFYI
ncbi:protein quiver-like [Lingula anatina]|uniref:UPAR/Ly6 domain-containing protein qvr n=1 Tax=Lingula anatina TaxID=7574 RepID=A0A1S3HYS3_LINAN|nr:protein quiver-like [Lingula anatina]|eukprot:XP_013390721.1 protein quiver-like [Lingula anatina]